MIDCYMPDSSSGVERTDSPWRESRTWYPRFSLSTINSQPLTLVNVRLGELERVLDQFDAWLGSTLDDNFHGIETKRNLRIIQHAQPGESAAGDASLLIVSDCFEWPAKILAAPSFHFHEDEGVVVATDEIDLAALVSLKTSV